MAEAGVPVFPRVKDIVRAADSTPRKGKARAWEGWTQWPPYTTVAPARAGQTESLRDVMAPACDSNAGEGPSVPRSARGEQKMAFCDAFVVLDDCLRPRLAGLLRGVVPLWSAAQQWFRDVTSANEARDKADQPQRSPRSGAKAGQLLLPPCPGCGATAAASGAPRACPAGHEWWHRAVARRQRLRAAMECGVVRRAAAAKIPDSLDLATVLYLLALVHPVDDDEEKFLLQLTAAGLRLREVGDAYSPGALFQRNRVSPGLNHWALVPFETLMHVVNAVKEAPSSVLFARNTSEKSKRTSREAGWLVEVINCCVGAIDKGTTAPCIDGNLRTLSGAGKNALWLMLYREWDRLQEFGTLAVAWAWVLVTGQLQYNNELLSRLVGRPLGRSGWPEFVGDYDIGTAVAMLQAVHRVAADVAGTRAQLAPEVAALGEMKTIVSSLRDIRLALAGLGRRTTDPAVRNALPSEESMNSLYQAGMDAMSSQGLDMKALRGLATRTLVADYGGNGISTLAPPLARADMQTVPASDRLIQSFQGSRDGVVVVTGGAGAGKTALLARYCAENGDRYKYVFWVGLAEASGDVYILMHQRIYGEPDSARRLRDKESTDDRTARNQKAKAEVIHHLTSYSSGSRGWLVVVECGGVDGSSVDEARTLTDELTKIGQEEAHKKGESRSQSRGSAESTARLKRHTAILVHGGDPTVSTLFAGYPVIEMEELSRADRNALLARTGGAVLKESLAKKSPLQAAVLGSCGDAIVNSKDLVFGQEDSVPDLLVAAKMRYLPRAAWPRGEWSLPANLQCIDNYLGQMGDTSGDDGRVMIRLLGCCGGYISLLHASYSHILWGSDTKRAIEAARAIAQWNIGSLVLQNGKIVAITCHAFVVNALRAKGGVLHQSDENWKRRTAQYAGSYLGAVVRSHLGQSVFVAEALSSRDVAILTRVCVGACAALGLVSAGYIEPPLLLLYFMTCAQLRPGMPSPASKAIAYMVKVFSKSFWAKREPAFVQISRAFVHRSLMDKPPGLIQSVGMDGSPYNDFISSVTADGFKGICHGGGDVSGDEHRLDNRVGGGGKQCLCDGLVMYLHVLHCDAATRARWRTAENEWKSLRSVIKKRMGPRHADFCNATMSLASVHDMQGRCAEAARLMEEVRSVRKEELGRSSGEYIAVLKSLSDVLTDMGEPSKALSLLEEARSIQEGMIGKVHPDYADTLELVAKVYDAADQPEESLGVLEEVKRIRSIVLGRMHPLYLSSLSALALAHDLAGHTARAAEEYELVSKLTLEGLGNQHPDYLESLMSSGAVLTSTGQFSDALKKYHEVHQVRAKTLGKAHEKTLSAGHNIGVTLRSLGRYNDALECLEDVMVSRREALGSRHPDYLTTVHHVGVVLRSLGKFTQAMDMFEEARIGRAQALGDRSRDYISTVSAIAGIHKARGDYADALEMYTRVRDARMELQGPRHPDYLTALANIAMVLKGTGQYAEALEMLKECRAGQEVILGPDHPTVLTCVHNIASVQLALGKTADALDGFKTAADRRKVALGPRHPDYLTSLNNVAVILRSMGQLSGALKVFRKVEAGTKSSLGDSHPSHLTAVHNVGSVLFAQGAFGEALRAFDYAKAGRLKSLGRAHPDYLATLTNMAIVYSAMNDYPRAMELYDEVRLQQEQSLGQSHPDYLTTLHNIAGLEGQHGDAEQALQNLKKVQSRRRASLGTMHPDTLSTGDLMATVMRRLGLEDEATSVLDDVLRGREATLGVNHPDYLATHRALNGMPPSSAMNGGKAEPSSRSEERSVLQPSLSARRLSSKRSDSDSGAGVDVEVASIRTSQGIGDGQSEDTHAGTDGQEPIDASNGGDDRVAPFECNHTYTLEQARTHALSLFGRMALGLGPVKCPRRDCGAKIRVQWMVKEGYAARLKDMMFALQAFYAPPLDSDGGSEGDDVSVELRPGDRSGRDSGVEVGIRDDEKSVDTSIASRSSNSVDVTVPSRSAAKAPKAAARQSKKKGKKK